MVLDNTNCVHSSLPASPDLDIRAYNRLGARVVIAARAQTLPDSAQTPSAVARWFLSSGAAQQSSARLRHCCVCKQRERIDCML